MASFLSESCRPRQTYSRDGCLLGNHLKESGNCLDNMHILRILFLVSKAINTATPLKFNFILLQQKQYSIFHQKYYIFLCSVSKKIVKFN